MPPCSNCAGTGFVSYEVRLSRRGFVIHERVQPCHVCQGSWKEWATKLVEGYQREIRGLPPAPTAGQ